MNDYRSDVSPVNNSDSDSDHVASKDPAQQGHQSSIISLRCPHEETLGP